MRVRLSETATGGKTSAYGATATASDAFDGTSRPYVHFAGRLAIHTAAAMLRGTPSTRNVACSFALSASVPRLYHVAHAAGSSFVTCVNVGAPTSLAGAQASHTAVPLDVSFTSKLIAASPVVVFTSSHGGKFAGLVVVVCVGGVARNLGYPDANGGAIPSGGRSSRP